METITKQKLLDLKYEEVGDTMRKKYPEKAQSGKEIGMVIFRKNPNSDSYILDNKFLMLFYYERSWDANEFLSNILKAMVQYREDMRALGLETEGGDPTADYSVKKVFETIGYSNTPDSFNDTIALAKKAMDNWHPNSTEGDSSGIGIAGIAFAPYIDTSNVTDMRDMFSGAYTLMSVPRYNTSKVTDMSNMFSECHSLASVPLFDTSKVTDMNHMFYNCGILTSVPEFDVSNVTDMSYMFSGCNLLGLDPESVPVFNDTSKVTNMSHMFSGCHQLVVPPTLDTSNVTDMSNMFDSCSRLTEQLPGYNTTKVTDMSGMFANCRRLKTVPAYDASNVTNMKDMFLNCEDLLHIFMTGMKCSFDISATNLGHEALVTLLNNLGTASNGATLTMGISKLAVLFDAEKQIATDKGWVLA